MTKEQIIAFLKAEQNRLGNLTGYEEDVEYLQYLLDSIEAGRPV